MNSFLYYLKPKMAQSKISQAGFVKCQRKLDEIFDFEFRTDFVLSNSQFQKLQRLLNELNDDDTPSDDRRVSKVVHSLDEIFDLVGESNEKRSKLEVYLMSKTALVINECLFFKMVTLCILVRTQLAGWKKLKTSKVRIGVQKSTVSVKVSCSLLSHECFFFYGKISKYLERSPFYWFKQWKGEGKTVEEEIGSHCKHLSKMEDDLNSMISLINLISNQYVNVSKKGDFIDQLYSLMLKNFGFLTFFLFASAYICSSFFERDSAGLLISSYEVSMLFNSKINYSNLFLVISKKLDCCGQQKAELRV